MSDYYGKTRNEAISFIVGLISRQQSEINALKSGGEDCRGLSWDQQDELFDALATAVDGGRS